MASNLSNGCTLYKCYKPNRNFPLHTHHFTESLTFKSDQMQIHEFTELLPGLPSDLGLECLISLPHSAHRVALRVCRQWRHLLQSDDFHHHRKKTGHTRTLACLVQARGQHASEESKKPPEGGSVSPTYDIVLFDPETMSWDRVDPVPEYLSGLPLFCQVASCDGQLVLMGGWDPKTYEPIKAVFVYDFRSAQWRRGRDMPEKRSFFAMGSGPGRVYVAGGHDENKNAMRTAWAYNPQSDEWVRLDPMTRERDECEGVVVGDEFWVVSGYATESQGVFEGSAEAFGFSSGKWRLVEGVWEMGRSPRSCTGIGNDGKAVSWIGSDPGLRVGVRGVVVGSRTLLTGSEYEGGPHGFYLSEKGKEGHNRKFRRINVPDDFSGFVQSGCYVEV